jgi:type VI secretion system protein VasD
MRGGRRLLLLAWSLALAAGCSSAAPPLLEGSIKSAASLNPDGQGRPSPILLRVYELRSLAAFNSADFFSLFDKEAETLGAELVGREEYSLQPAETKPYRRQLQPDTKFVGVAAAFRDLDNAKWRQAAPVPASRKISITVGLDARSVTVAVK